ncbi:hypothetical protein OG800_01280 [Streptomyces sp. NBC_00445]|uniref:hypothetical protein n=1 Tax=unclassified Streptomyces TaxID=2593676 RepID=UPI002E1DFE06|nr:MULTISPECIES: hypothetical protein [unclassified Streptomyces]
MSRLFNDEGAKAILMNLATSVGRRGGTAIFGPITALMNNAGLSVLNASHQADGNPRRRTAPPPLPGPVDHDTEMISSAAHPVRATQRRVRAQVARFPALMAHLTVTMCPRVRPTVVPRQGSGVAVDPVLPARTHYDEVRER